MKAAQPPTSSPPSSPPPNRISVSAQSTSLQVYESFLTRTEPKLRQAPFNPPLLEDGGNRVAVIVEPRSEESIVKRTAHVIRNVGVLAPGWSIQFFHGTTNLKAIASHFTEEEQSRIACVNLGVDNLSSSQEYSQLLTSFWFGSVLARRVCPVRQTQQAHADTHHYQAASRTRIHTPPPLPPSHTPLPFPSTHRS